MINKLQIATSVLKQEGLFSFFKKGSRYLYNWFSQRKHKYLIWFYLPICVLKVKNFRNKKKSINEIIDFTFNICDGFISPLQVKSEIKTLLTYLSENKPGSMLEIGTAKGGTLFMFSQIASNDALIISLDLPKGEFGGGYPFYKIPLFKSFAKESQKIELVRANSHDKEVFEKIKKMLSGKKVDFLFIDGDHTYEGVKKDFEMYSRLVKEDGIVALHDIPYHPQTNCEVNKFWQELKVSYKHEEIVEDWGKKQAGIGLIKLNEKI